MIWKKTGSTKCFQFLFCFGLIQILPRNALTSSTMTFLFLYFVPLPFTAVVQPAPPSLPSLWIRVPLGSTPHPFSCLGGSLLSTQRLSLVTLNLLMFPLFLIYSSYSPTSAFSGTCLASPYFLSHYKETSLSI